MKTEREHLFSLSRDMAVIIHITVQKNSYLCLLFSHLAILSHCWWDFDWCAPENIYGMLINLWEPHACNQTYQLSECWNDQLRKIIINYSDNWLINHSSSKKIPGSSWYQLLNIEDLLHLFFFGDNKLNISEVWAVGRAKQAVRRHPLGLKTTAMGIFYHFLTF